MKRIRMRMSVSGAHLGNPDGSKVGDILDVEDGVAEQYVRNGYATLILDVDNPKIETAVLAPEVETAALATEGETTATVTATVTEAPAKRGPGRPRRE